MLRYAAIILIICGCAPAQPTLLAPTVSTTLAATTQPATQPSPEMSYRWEREDEGDTDTTDWTISAAAVLEWAVEYHDLLIGCTTFTAGILVGRRKKAA